MTYCTLFCRLCVRPLFLQFKVVCRSLFGVGSWDLSWSMVISLPVRDFTALVHVPFLITLSWNSPDVSHHLRVFTACVAFPVYKAVRIEHPSHFYVFNGLEEQPLKATQRVNVRPRHGWSYSLFLLSGPPSVFLLVQNQGSPWPVWWKVYILGRTTECCSPFHAAPDELFDAFLHPPPQWFLARHVIPVTSAKAS